MYELGDTFIVAKRPFFIGDLKKETVTYNIQIMQLEPTVYIVNKNNICKLTMPKSLAYKIHARNNFKISRIMLTERIWKQEKS